MNNSMEDHFTIIEDPDDYGLMWQVVCLICDEFNQFILQDELIEFMQNHQH